MFGLLGAPYQFYERNPSGRILTRVSKDVSDIDMMLADRVQFLLMTILRVIGILVIITVVAWLFLVFLIPLIFFYYTIGKYYRNSSREMQRLEAQTRGPLLSALTELINGLTTVRAFGKESYFIAMKDKALATNLRAFQSQRILEIWLSLHLTALGIAIVGSAGLSIILMHRYHDEPWFIGPRVTPAFAGLAL